MITIYICPICSDKLREYGEFYHDYVLKKKSNHKQWRYILDCNKRDAIIAVLPHKKSMLRKYFIQPNLDDEGYAIEGDYECRLNNFTIKYRLIHGKITENEFELVNENYKSVLNNNSDFKIVEPNYSYRE